jgi:hypothetical protein
MSALPAIADMCGALAHVGFGQLSRPLPDAMTADIVKH